jgi:hypothetical protein
MSRALTLLATATAALLGATLVPTAIRHASGPSADHAPALVEAGWPGTSLVATSIL